MDHDSSSSADCIITVLFVAGTSLFFLKLVISGREFMQVPTCVVTDYMHCNKQAHSNRQA